MGEPGPLSEGRGGSPGQAHVLASGERLMRADRLRKSELFREAYDQGRRWIGRYMVLWLREGDGAALRLGVVAGRKVGGAVARTRAKRRLREVYRRNRKHLAGPFDVVLVARKSMVEAAWNDIVREFTELSRRAGLARGAEKLET